MPELTEEEIKELVANGKIVGIAIDTSIFDRYACDLNHPLLQSLAQFSKEPVAIVISDIVKNEVISHIVDQSQKTLDGLQKALRNHIKRWRREADMDALLHALTDSKDAGAIGDIQFVDFVNAIEAEILPAVLDISVAHEAVERYFSAKPPFEEKKDKKSEFPDAFALLSIEKRFADEDQMVVAVSTDNGWKSFADASPVVICVDNLETALSYFNEAGRHIVERVMGMLEDASAKSLIDEIELAIQARLDDADFDPEGDSYLEYEAEAVGAALNTVDFSNTSHLRTIRYSEDSVTFSLEVQISCEFEAEFRFFAYDSVDKDYVSLSDQVFFIERRLPISIIVEIAREFTDEPEVISASATLPRNYSIDFGQLEPFPGEDPTHEKY